MSLLLSDDMFNLASSAAVDSESATTSSDFDLNRYAETNKRLETNEDVDVAVIIDSNRRSQCEQKDVDALSDVMRCTADVDTQLSADELSTHRQHGVHSFRYALHVDIATHITVEQNEDNTDVVRTLQELTTLLSNRYVPAVKRWLEVNILCCSWVFFSRFNKDLRQARDQGLATL